VEDSPSVSGTFTLENATLGGVEVTIDEVTGESCSAEDDSNLTDTTYEFSCTLPKMTLSDVSGKKITVKIAAEENWDVADSSKEASWTANGSVAANSINGSAYMVDDLAGLSNAQVLSGGASVSGGKLTSDSNSGSFSVTYKLTGVAACTAPKNSVDLFPSDGSTALASANKTVDLPCVTVPGLTIGYWGNKMGGTEAISKKGTWRGGWPILDNMSIPKTVTKTTTVIDPKTKKSTTKTTTEVVQVYPKDWISDSDVRAFMTLANCSTDCKTMLMAQGLASAMNVLRNPGFGTQAVWFGTRCARVNDLLNEALGPTSSSMLTWSTAKRTAYKTIFDDLNNTRAKGCAPSQVTGP
jgi:hypothetical protein